jgi:hypothetical protein
MNFASRLLVTRVLVRSSSATINRCHLDNDVFHNSLRIAMKANKNDWSDGDAAPEAA